MFRQSGWLTRSLELTFWFYLLPVQFTLSASSCFSFVTSSFASNTTASPPRYGVTWFTRESLWNIKKLEIRLIFNAKQCLRMKQVQHTEFSSYTLFSLDEDKMMKQGETFMVSYSVSSVSLFSLQIIDEGKEYKKIVKNLSHLTKTFCSNFVPWIPLTLCWNQSLLAINSWIVWT